MTPVEHFRHCPRCGSPRASEPTIPFRCTACGFVYYLNPTVSAVGIISRSDGKVLFIRRAKEPAKGMLSFPGGFIDLGETAEAALRRETREEVGIEIHEPQLLCSQPNQYTYREVTYPVLDLVFRARAEADAEARPLDGVSEVMWLPPAGVRLEDIAFPSLRAGLQHYLGA